MRCLPERLIAAQLVELGIDAVANDAAVAGERPAARRAASVERLADVGEVVELRDQAADERRLKIVEQQLHARDGSERLAERDEIARPGGAERGASDQPLDVVDRLQACRAAFARSVVAERELLDRIEPILDPLERHERPQQPRAEQAAAHRRDGAIDLVEQRPVRPPSAASMTSRFRSVVGSIEQASAPVRKAISRTCARSAFCVSRRYCTRAPAARTAGGCGRRARNRPASALLHLVDQRAPCRLELECPGVDRVTRAVERATPADERGRVLDAPAARSPAAEAPRVRRQAPGAPSRPDTRRS